MSHTRALATPLAAGGEVEGLSDSEAGDVVVLLVHESSGAVHHKLVQLPVIVCHHTPHLRQHQRASECRMLLTAGLCTQAVICIGGRVVVVGGSVHG